MGLFQELGQKLGLVEEQPMEKAQEVQEEKNVAEKAPVQQSSTRFAMQAPVQAAAPGQIIGKVNEEVYKMLSDAVDASNLDGNDFLEFMQSLNSMKHLTVDENTKFNMVFSTLASTQGGFTKEICLNSIKHYLGVIDGEKAIFLGEMQNATNSLVNEKIAEKERLEQMAQSKAEQIQLLQEEIEQISSNVGELNTEAEDAKVKIAQKEADFEVTLEQLVGQLTSYEKKVNEILEATEYPYVIKDSDLTLQQKIIRDADFMQLSEGIRLQANILGMAKESGNDVKKWLTIQKGFVTNCKFNTETAKKMKEVFWDEMLEELDYLIKIVK